MKPNKLITIFLFMVLLFTFSCKKSDEKQLSDGKVNYDKIGVMHNQGLDYAYKALKSAKENGLLKFNNEDYINLLFKSTLSNVETTNYTLNENELEKVKASLLVAKNRLVKLSNTKKADEYIYQSILSEAESMLTTKQKEISKKILQVMIENSNIDTVIKNLNQIETEVNSTCNDIEKVGLLSMLSVAKHSSEYWNSNLSLWNEEFGISKNNAKFSWGLVGAGDAAYALLTGVECSTVLVVPFIGWGTYIGIVGGGTVIVSGWACIAQLII